MKVIRIELADGETRYLNPSFVKEVKISESKYEECVCMTVILQDNDIITKLYNNKEDAEKMVAYIIECMTES